MALITAVKSVKESTRMAAVNIGGLFLHPNYIPWPVDGGSWWKLERHAE
jgi:hypothetical protein